MRQIWRMCRRLATPALEDLIDWVAFLVQNLWQNN